MSTPSPTAPRTERKAWADVTKGVAMIMVVFYHASLYLLHNGVDGVPSRAKAIFELFPMPAFFLIAGLFGARMLTWSFRELWYRRLWPILYLYLVWSVIRTLYYLAMPGVAGELGELPASHPLTLALVFLWPSSSYWFLYALAIYVVVAWLLRKVPPAVTVGALAVVSTAFTTGLVQTGNLGWNRVGALAVFYVGGVVYSQKITTLVGRARPWTVWAALGVFLTIGALLLLGLRPVPFLALAGQASAVGFGVLAATLVARTRAAGFLSGIGVRSLPIYLLHLYVIVPIATLIGLLDPQWPWPVETVTVFALAAFALWASVRLHSVTAKVRWLYVAPAWLGGPGRTARARARQADAPTTEIPDHPAPRGRERPALARRGDAA